MSAAVAEAAFPACLTSGDARLCRLGLRLARVAAGIETGTLAPGTHPLLWLADAEMPSSDMSEEGLPLHTPDTQAETFFRMMIRARMLDIMEGIYGLREALLDLSDRGPATPEAPGAPWALMCDTALSRDSERLVASFGRLNRSPAGTCTDGALFRMKLAGFLGFEGVLDDLCDIRTSRDAELELGATLLILTRTLLRLTEDLSHGLATGGPGAGPLKPVRLALVHLRGLSAHAFGTFTRMAADPQGADGQRPVLLDLGDQVTGQLPRLAGLMRRVHDGGNPAAPRHDSPARARIRLGRHRLEDRMLALDRAQTLLEKTLSTAPEPQKTQIRA